MSQLIDADANWSSGTCGGTHDFEPDSASPVDLLGALVEHLAKRGIKPQLARKGTYDPSGALDAVADLMRLLGVAPTGFGATATLLDVLERHAHTSAKLVSRMEPYDLVWRSMVTMHATTGVRSRLLSSMIPAVELTAESLLLRLGMAAPLPVKRLPARAV